MVECFLYLTSVCRKISGGMMLKTNKKLNCLMLHFQHVQLFVDTVNKARQTTNKVQSNKQIKADPHTTLPAVGTPHYSQVLVNLHVLPFPLFWSAEQIAWMPQADVPIFKGTVIKSERWGGGKSKLGCCLFAYRAGVISGTNTKNNPNSVCDKTRSVKGNGTENKAAVPVEAMRL